MVIIIVMVTQERSQRKRKGYAWCPSSLLACMYKCTLPAGCQRRKKSNSPANQTHLCAEWGVLTEHDPQAALPPFRLQSFNNTHESIQDVHSPSHLSQLIKVKQQKLGMRFIFLPFSLFSPQASQSDLASRLDVFIIQIAMLSVAVTCHALFSMMLSSCKQTNRALLWRH